MSLLDPKSWQPHPLSGPEYAVTEPATGDTLATVTLAGAEDVERSAVAARAAQTEWARLPHFVRAGVLRKAGDLFSAHADELREWLVRESGSIPGKADFELHVAAQECYEAAALASRPAGQVLPSEAPRLSYAPGPGRRRGRDRALQRPVDPLDPLRRPGPGAGQRGDPEAGPAHRGLRRPLARRRPRRGRAARGAAPCSARRPRRRPGPGRRPARARDLLHRIDRGGPRGGGGGGTAPQARPPGARRQLRADRPGGRRRRGRRSPRRPGDPSSTRARSA